MTPAPVVCRLPPVRASLTLVLLACLLFAPAGVAPARAAAAAGAGSDAGTRTGQAAPGDTLPTTIRQPPAQVPLGLRMALHRAQVSGPAGRAVLLQRKRAGAWRTVARAATDAAGWVVLRANLPPGVSRWRVRVPRSGRHPAATGRQVRIRAGDTPNPTFGVNVWDPAELPRIATSVGASPRVVGIFRDWAHAPDFPTADARALDASGAIPMIAWEPWDAESAAERDPAFASAQIASGRYDTLIERWAGQARSYGDPVLIRLAPEQNGDWRPWSIGTPGNGASDYRRAWRRVVRIFRVTGAHNVLWVWNPYVEVGGSTPMMAGYPGDSWVDLIGVDGYNWGDTRPWGWQSYDDIFASTVGILHRRAATKPWFIAEVSSAMGALRSAWIADTVACARRDGAAALVWFEFDKETDWRLSVDPDATTALRHALDR